jgi:membrane peptidoglycan carboxypeptidase
MRARREERERKRAEDLATLPKQPVKRFFAHFHPKRVFRYWFSTRGLFMFLKIMGVCILIGALAIGGLFLYFKKDLDAIRPEELANRVQGTVNTYLDRNGVLLWEDKGDGDYRLVVNGDEISTYMRQATVAVEDKRFYDHMGVDLIGLARAFFATMSGQQVQGGSTLTQQLIKQVYFSDESADRSMSGIPRKIKETILAIEIERMYSKEEIITLYLNESPYGGRRNGVESGAQTYFGKSAKDLTLAEASLLSAIPNNPAIFNPYNKDLIDTDGTTGSDLNLNGVKDTDELIWRQHYTLDTMVELGYITAEQAQEAKEVDILATILPEVSQYKNIKAPHFVLEVKKQLEAKYGVKTMRAGGYTIRTSLDYRAQLIAEDAVRAATEVRDKNRLTNAIDNIAMSSIDVETGQVIAMVGSIDWNTPGYGQTNAATSVLEPGSTIKPVLDYAPLFMQREGQNFGPGTVLRDENIDWLYCAGATGKCSLNNYSGRFNGSIPIRQSLASSLNIPAVKALYINGAENSLPVLHALGDLSYCSNDEYLGLHIAIGSGCGVRPVEHANTYASLARGGVYKSLAYYLEVKNSDGDVIDRWEDSAGDRAVDEQVAYMISSILSDKDARKLGFGNNYNPRGLIIPDVWTAVKTGTTDSGRGYAKDNWYASYSPVIATTAWTGNHDGRAWVADLANTSSYIPREVIAVYMERVHKEVYIPDGKYVAGQGVPRPSGIQELTVNGRKDIWPSWYNTKTSGVEKVKLTFDRITGNLATDCTPNETRIELEVTKTVDPVTKKEIWNIPDGYDREAQDVLHQCGERTPSVGSFSAVFDSSATTIAFTASVTSGDHTLTNYEIWIDGTQVKSGSVSALTGGSSVTISRDTAGSRATLIIHDAGGYTRQKEVSITSI